MKTGIGYLNALHNPNFSGIATVIIRSAKRPTAKTKYTTCYVDAGFGVRQIVAALGERGRRLTQHSGKIQFRYEINELNLLTSLEPLEEFRAAW